MRYLLLLSLALLVLTAGCKKASNKTTTGTGGPAPAGGMATTGAVGGGGGVIQGVRQAVNRIVTENEMRNIHILIENASTASGQLPSIQEISAGLQSGAPKTWKLVEEGAIVLTGTRKRENIWAYTKESQNAAGQHFIVSSSGVEPISGQMLDQRLRSEQGP